LDEIELRGTRTPTRRWRATMPRCGNGRSFDYEKGKFGLFELMDVKEYATNILGRNADIMTRDSLHRTLRRQIETTAERVF
jgi:hypothetical protein